MPLRRAPLESFLKLFMALLGILGEYVTGMKVSFTDPNAARHNTSVEVTLPHVHSEHEHSIQARDVNPNGMIKVWHFETGNLQHITMYTGFGLGAIIEILLHYRFDVPKKLDYVCGVIGFSTEALLFYFHLHGRDPIDVHLHTLQFYSILGCIFFIILEMYNHNQVMNHLSGILGGHTHTLSYIYIVLLIHTLDFV